MKKSQFWLAALVAVLCMALSPVVAMAATNFVGSQNDESHIAAIVDLDSAAQLDTLVDNADAVNLSNPLSTTADVDTGVMVEIANSTEVANRIIFEMRLALFLWETPDLANHDVPPGILMNETVEAVALIYVGETASPPLRQLALVGLGSSLVPMDVAMFLGIFFGNSEILMTPPMRQLALQIMAPTEVLAFEFWFDKLGETAEMVAIVIWFTPTKAVAFLMGEEVHCSNIVASLTTRSQARA